MKKVRNVLLGVLCTLALLSQGQNVEGKLVDTHGDPLEFATVGVKGTTKGAVTSEGGKFKLDLAPGTYVLVISSVGYHPFERSIEVRDVLLNLGDIALKEDFLGLNEVVVTGTMTETFLKSSPVKVEVVTSEYLQKNITPTNLVEGISLINGLQEVVACGVCFTNSISINGLPGPYTAALMDGAPIYGNLAATYGLNGIPVSIIDRIEIIKGPSSTLYGSEAVAGVINIITKNPSEHALFSADIMGTSHLESFGNLAFSPRGEKSQGYVGLNYAYINDFDDNNNDGFSDIINLDRYSLFTKWNISRPSEKLLTVAGKLYYEDRRNGVQQFLQNRAYRNLRGDDSIYGESIYTYRAEVFGRYQLAERLNFDYSFSRHHQDSYYGSDHYLADQSILFGNLTWSKSANNHQLLTGLTLRKEMYDDNTVATEKVEMNETINLPENNFTPGLFIQDEWTATQKLTVLAGARYDQHPTHGGSFSPRLSIKYSPGTYTTLRLNSGTGFKVVNLFTEDHAFITGQREVIIAERLNPERSANTTVNLNHVYTLGESQGMLDVDLYYTYFTNKIIPDYSNPGQIIYENSDGNAITKGISVNLTHQFLFPLSFTTGATFQRAFESLENTERNIEFAPSWSTVSTVNYEWKNPGITFAYTLQVTGSMQLPEVFDLDENGLPLPTSRPTRSQPFAFQNFQVTKEFNEELSVYFGLQNLFNYQQEYSPLVGFNDPNAATGFSPFFDTSYAFSPIHGREIYVGISWNLGK